MLRVILAQHNEAAMEIDLTSPRLWVAVAVWGGLLWQGYRARRRVWTRRSWWRFGLLLGTTASLVVISLVMAYGVDAGVYKHISPMLGRLYFYTMFALVMGGIVGSFTVLIWFANGRPDRQLG
jgi:hypothetical protein